MHIVQTVVGRTASYLDGDGLAGQAVGAAGGGGAAIIPGSLTRLRLFAPAAG
jgi:hypothetical protein